MVTVLSGKSAFYTDFWGFDIQGFVHFEILIGLSKRKSGNNGKTFGIFEEYSVVFSQSASQRFSCVLEMNCSIRRLMALGRKKTENSQGVREILFSQVNAKERTISKIRSRPCNFAWINRLWNFKPQKFAAVATVTWIVGSSKFWYQSDRIYVVFHHMNSDFQISQFSKSIYPRKTVWTGLNVSMLSGNSDMFFHMNLSK